MARDRGPGTLLAALLLAAAAAPPASAAAATAPAGAQDAPRTDPPRSPLDHRSLRALSLDLYGRPPSDDERARWLGRDRAEFAAAALGAEEAWEHWLGEQLYYFLLVDNFAPASEAVRELPAALARGTLSARDALHRVALSPSFDLRNPGADTFVTVVMEQLGGFRIEAAQRELEIGKRVYAGGRGTFLGQPGSSQADVVRNAVQHESFAEHFLRREHERVLRRAPPSKDLALWCRDFRADPASFRGLLAAWILSPAWDARLERPAPQPNRLFVRSLYMDLTGELPPAEEQNRMRAALDALADPGPLRGVLARLLLDSGRARLPERQQIDEPRIWIGGLFTRLLGREASAGELEAFAAAFDEPDCRPATIVYALISDREYQNY